MPRRQPGTIHRLIQPEPALRGQDYLLGDLGRAAGEPAADDLLSHPTAVHISRIDERPARLDKTVKLPMRARLVCLRAERHTPQAQTRHRAAAGTQSAIVHASTYAATPIKPQLSLRAMPQPGPANLSATFRVAAIAVPASAATF